MQFKHPEILYALLLLIIPIIVHLFQLRRFQKVSFTNVQFLKNVVLQTRKSSKIKKWLILCVRLILLASIIVAFAQPYKSQFQSLETKTETVIYLDNSFSMQAKGNKGELLKRAVQDIIDSLDENDQVTIFTNSGNLIKGTKNTFINDLLQLDYCSNQLDYDAVILKGKLLFSKDISSSKNLILLSDFQVQEKDFKIPSDSLINISLVKLQPENYNNISIDSVFISKTDVDNIELSVLVKQQGNILNDIPISLYNKTNLVSKTTVIGEGKLTGIFTIPNNVEINGIITVEDDNLSFDNILYFNINKHPKINVLSINSNDDSFLKRIFTKDEFNYNAVEFAQLNYSEISQQNLIVLNELDDLPIALTNSLSSFINNGGNILIIPSGNITLTSYNHFFRILNDIKVDSLNVAEKSVTNINFSHPIFNDVFDKKVSNFQYPKVNSFYSLSSSESSILRFEDGNPFLLQSGRLFVFASALNFENSNFINSPLIVPTLYNIGKQSLKQPKLYFTIGEENIYDVNLILQQDDILKLKSSITEIIPQQRIYSNKVTITTTETPEIADTYAITGKTGPFEYVSYNYNRKESNMSYLDNSLIDKATIINSIPQVFSEIKSKANVNELWKWFVIFALLLIIVEMLILKYFK